MRYKNITSVSLINQKLRVLAKTTQEYKTIQNNPTSTENLPGPLRAQLWLRRSGWPKSVVLVPVDFCVRSRSWNITLQITRANLYCQILNSWGTFYCQYNRSFGLELYSATTMKGQGSIIKHHVAIITGHREHLHRHGWEVASKTQTTTDATLK